MVVNSRNPIYSIVFLILVFVNSAGLLLYLGAEFIGMIFLVVYIGAIAVLFLFVVMMINIRYVELTSSELYYLPINGLLLMVPVSIQLGYSFYFMLDQSVLNSDIFVSEFFSSSNLEVLGFLLYSSRYYFVVILSSLILLVAMVGSISLTLVHRFDVRRQDVFEQLSTDASFRLMLFK